ncbi:MAG: hypothetical protein AAGA15_09365 [Pseudomonadota bacterium]
MKPKIVSDTFSPEKSNSKNSLDDAMTARWYKPGESDQPPLPKGGSGIKTPKPTKSNKK